MKGILRKIIIVSVLCAIMILTSVNFLFNWETEEIQASETISLSKARQMFPDGSYWNHIVNGYDTYADVLMNRWDNTFAYTVTSRACENHGIAAPNDNTTDCNAYNGKVQCKGFAYMLANLLYGTDPSTSSEWVQHYDRAAIKPGDILVYWDQYTQSAEYGHTVLVIDIAENGNLILAEANYLYPCMIKWDREYNIYSSNVTGYIIYSAPYELRDSGIVGYLDEYHVGPGYIWVKGWVMDFDDMTKSIQAHVYIGGPAENYGQTGVQRYVLTANKERTDVAEAFSGAGAYHGYESTLSAKVYGEQPIYVYAYNPDTEERILIDSKTVYIPKQGEPTGVTLNYSTLTLTSVGSQVAATATVSPSDATDKTVTWTSSDSAVATVSQSGVITAVNNGVTTITATTNSGRASASCRVYVSIHPTGVSLDKTNVKLTRIGSTMQLNASVLPTNAANQNVTWSSSNTSVATVSNTGLITAVGNGTAMITVSTEIGSKTANCYVVVDTSVTGVTLDTKAAELCGKGATVQLNATVYPTTANQAVTWSTSNTSVATVSSTGLVTAVGSGTAVITATTVDGGKTVTCTVTVEVPTVSSDGWYYVSSLPSDITSTYYDIQYQNVYEQYAASSPGTGWVDTGVDKNEYTKSGSTYESDFPLTTSDTVRLDSYYYYHWCGPSTGIHVNYCASGNYVHWDGVTADRVYEYASYTDVDDSRYVYYHLKWNDGSDAYCSSGSTCDGSSGEHGGRAYYWYKRYVYQNYAVETLNQYQKASDWGTTKDSSASIVNIRYRLKPTGVAINKTSATLTSAGATVQLTATVSPSDAGDKSVTWTSSNTAVATVSSSGVVTAVGNGTVTITATTNSGAKTATCKVTVSIATTGVSLNKTSATLNAEGATVQLTATVSPSNAANKNVTWLSSNTSVATVDSNGLVRAVGNGTAIITATTESGSKTATFKVTVSISTTGVSLNKTSAILTDEGQTLQLIATVSPSNAANKKVTWKSSNTAVATVDANGVVTAVGDGIATITATTASGSKTATCTVTVDATVPLVIVSQPEKKIANEGEAALFSVFAEGKNISYQWQFSKDGTYWSDSSMEGSNTNAMIVQALASRDGYQYRCVVTDTKGQKVITEPATLSVITMVITEQPQNQKVTVNDYTLFTVKVDGTNLDYQWQFSKDGSYWSNSSMEGSTTASMKVQALVSRDGYQYRCVITDVNGKQMVSESATLTVNTIVITAQPESQDVTINEYATLLVKAEGSGLKYQWQCCKDGEYWFDSSMTGANTASMKVQALTGRDGYQYRCVITDVNGKKVITEPATLTVNTIVITAQPESQAIKVNEYTDFTVKAEGTGLKYQWQFCRDGEYWSDSSMTGSTTASMKVQALVGRDGYQYRCVITDANGKKAITEPATLTVNTIVITAQSESRAIKVNEYTDFTVKAEGTGLKYQWQCCKDGEYWFDSSMTGADTASMKVQALTGRDGYQYRCVITDANGKKVITEPATLSVKTIVITQQPESQTVLTNKYTAFTVEAEGTGLKYQWQFCKDGSYWSNSSMAGSTTASMQVQALAGRDGYQYRCVITDANGKQVVTEAATLTVSTVVITTQPVDKMVLTNKYTSFTVKAEGTGLTYQWQFCKDGKYWSNSSMAGSTTASMQVQGLASRNGYQYRCVVTDANGNKVISEAAALTVGEIVIISQPGNQTVKENIYVLFTLIAEGNGLKYQWQFCKDGEYWSNSSMTGSTTASMQVQALASRDGYRYRCIVTDADGNQVVSEVAELTVQ